MQRHVGEAARHQAMVAVVDFQFHEQRARAWSSYVRGAGNLRLDLAIGPAASADVGDVADMDERHVALLDIDVHAQSAFVRDASGPAGCWSGWWSSSAPARPASTKRAVTMPSNGARNFSYDFMTASWATFCDRHAEIGIGLVRRLDRAVQPCAIRSRRPQAFLLLVRQVGHGAVVLPVGLRRLHLGHHLAGLDTCRRDRPGSTSRSRRTFA